MPRRIRALAAAALALALLAGCTLPAAEVVTAPSPLGRETGEVVEVVDGDTIKVRLAGTVRSIRYIGIDTPETRDPRRGVQCFGKEASARNKALVAGRTVELERDISDTDRFERLLRYVWLDGQMINETLVREGYAKASSYPPDVRYQDRFRAAEREARTAGRGLWNACPAG